MTSLIIVGLILYFFFKLVTKIAGISDNSSKSRSVSPPVNRQINRSSSYQDTSTYRRSVAQASASSTQKRTTSSFHDESIIEVTPEPVRISYDNYYNDFENRSVYASAYDPDEYKLGKKYKDKLALSKTEVGWLNKFWNDANVFNSIEGCETEIVKLYVASIKRINSTLKKDASTLTSEIEAISQRSLESEKSEAAYWTEYDVRAHKESVEKEVYQVIYKRSESAIRDRWNHKRKIQAEFYPYSPTIKAMFDERLAVVIDDAIKKCSQQIGEPNDDTEIALNETGTGRWKILFEQITNACNPENLSETVAKLYKLGELNARNPHVEHVFYEASKFLANLDKLESLKFYLHYIWHDLNSKQVDNKQLNKTIQKKLFSRQLELDAFQSIVDELVKSKDLVKALTEVSGVYATKRKHIALDLGAVQLAEKQHAGTVDILNGYLRDDHETAHTAGGGQAQDEEVTIKIDSVEANTGQVDDPENLHFSKAQYQCLKHFEENGFTLSFDATDSFARANGLFKNQLIDGINDRCMEILDDILIEEVEDGFEVNITYYKQLYPA